MCIHRRFGCKCAVSPFDPHNMAVSVVSVASLKFRRGIMGLMGVVLNRISPSEKVRGGCMTASIMGLIIIVTVMEQHISDCGGSCSTVVAWWFADQWVE